MMTEYDLAELHRQLLVYLPLFFSKDIEILNQLINEFNQEKIQKINELSEIIYYLKLYKGF